MSSSKPCPFFCAHSPVLSICYILKINCAFDFLAMLKNSWASQIHLHSVIISFRKNDAVDVAMRMVKTLSNLNAYLKWVLYFIIRPIVSILCEFLIFLIIVLNKTIVDSAMLYYTVREREVWRRIDG